MSKSDEDLQKSIESLKKALENYEYVPISVGGGPLIVEDLKLTTDPDGAVYPAGMKRIKFEDKPLVLKNPNLKDADFPHECSKCKGPAYIGLNNVDCKAKCK